MCCWVEERMIHTGQTEGGGIRFHRATQNGWPFKISALSVSGIFHLGHCWQWVTETEESKIADKGSHCTCRIKQLTVELIHLTITLY